MAEPLTDADRSAAFDGAVPSWFVERLNTRLGTDQVVRLLKQQSQCYGSVSHCEDGPYSEFSRWIERCPRGMHVRVLHHGAEDELIREGYVSWNELANRATFAALQLRHGSEEALAAQGKLF